MQRQAIGSIVLERLVSCVFYLREGDLSLACQHLHHAQLYIPYLRADVGLRANQLAEALAVIGMARQIQHTSAICTR